MIFQAELADSIQALWANPLPFILLALIKFLLAVHALILVVGRPLLEPFLMSVPEIVSSLRKLFRKFHRRVEDCVALPLHRRRAMDIDAIDIKLGFWWVSERRFHGRTFELEPKWLW